MIAKIIRHPGFVEPTFYALKDSTEPLKHPEVLAANGVRTGSAGEMAADFELQRSARPKLRKAVEHIALAWLPEETAKLTNEVMTRAAMMYLEERGIDPATTQWALVRHHDQEHPHCHLILNRVTDDGQVLSDKQSHHVSAAACRKVEATMGFVDAAALGREAKLKQAEQGEFPEDVAERLQCKALILRAMEKHLPGATTVRELREALATEGVQMRATLQQGGQLQAVVFQVDAYPGLHVKGSEVAREYSGVGLRKTLEAQAALRKQTAVTNELPQQPEVAVVPEPTKVLSSKQGAAATPPQVIVTPVEVPVETVRVPTETVKNLPPAPSIDRPASVSLPERSEPLPVPAPEVKPLPPVVHPGPVEVAELPVVIPAEVKTAAVPPSMVAVAPAASPAAAPLAAPTTQSPLPASAVESQRPLPASQAERLVAAVPDAPAVVVPAVALAAELLWQRGIIRMMDTELRTGEARLSNIGVALVKAGATVGEVEAPTAGQKTSALLTYSFDPASPRLDEVNHVLREIQASCFRKDADTGKYIRTGKMQEQPHPWHQPGTVPEADRLQWPEREGQFNQAQILVDDPVRGQVRAEAVANDLRAVGAIVGEVTRDDHGLLTLQVHYHTHAPSVEDIHDVFIKVARTASMELKESAQDLETRKDGIITLALRQEAMKADRERGA